MHHSLYMTDEELERFGIKEVGPQRWIFDDFTQFKTGVSIVFTERPSIYDFMSELIDQGRLKGRYEIKEEFSKLMGIGQWKKS